MRQKLFILILINSSLHLSHLISGCNELKITPYFPKVLFSPAEAIFRRTVIEMTNTMTNLRHSLKQ